MSSKKLHYLVIFGYGKVKPTNFLGFGNLEGFYMRYLGDCAISFHRRDELVKSVREQSSSYH